MRIILDTANLKDIEYYNNYYPIEGVTTNPTILAREGGDVLELLKNKKECAWTKSKFLNTIFAFF